jgi:DNA-binding beta-propeller fold protein YncE
MSYQEKYINLTQISYEVEYYTGRIKFVPVVATPLDQFVATHVAQSVVEPVAQLVVIQVAQFVAEQVAQLVAQVAVEPVQQPKQIFVDDMIVKPIIISSINNPEFVRPTGIAIMIRDGIITKIIADPGNNRIYSITDDGNIHLIAGTHKDGYRDGPRLQSQFNLPHGVAVMADHTIIVADTVNHYIRAIGLDGIVRTIAGQGLESDFRYPMGVAVMADQTIIVADTANHRIRAMRAINGIYRVRTIAGNIYRGFRDGNGTDAYFNAPTGIAIMPDQSIVVADTNNHCIRILRANREIDPTVSNDVLTAIDYTISTIAGTGKYGLRDGPNREAQFREPHGVAVRGDHLIIADSYNNCIRTISVDGYVSTIAGNGTWGNQFGPGREAQFSNPRGIAIMPDQQTIIIADSGNHRICKISEEVQAPPS